MADNVVLDPGTGGATVKTDDDGTAHWQYIKAAYGADNTQTRVTSANGLPVQNDSANAFVVDLGATDNAVLDAIAAGYAAEGAALGSGVLLQGDDGTDRKNINVDATTGDVQVDVTNTVTVDGSGVTQPVSAASLPLPSGASTAANQSTIIGHVDGIEALLTAIDADTSDIHTNSDTIAAGFATEGSALGSGVLMQADDGTDRTNVLVDTDGHLQVDVLSGGGSGTEYSEDAATPATISGTATLIERDDALTTVTPVEGDWIGLRGTAEGALWVQDFNSDAILADTASMDTNLGTLAGAVSGSEMQVDVVTSALPSGAATNNTLSLIADAYAAEGAAVLSSGVLLQADDGTDRHNLQTNSVGDLKVTLDSEAVALSALPAGTNNIGDVDIASALPTGSNTIGTVNLGATDNAVLDNIDTQTTPAASMYRNVDANAEAAIKASAGRLDWLHVMNMTAAVAYLHLYDATTASVTPGTTTPDFTFPIPTAGSTNGAGFNLPLGPNGQDFATAITLVVTTTIDGSTGDPGTNGVFVNAGYT